MTRPVSERLSLRLPLGVLEELDRLADEAGTNRSAVAERALVTGLGKVDIRALRLEVKAARKAALQVRAALLRVVREAVEEWEKGLEAK